jgi:hypothetical protein
MCSMSLTRIVDVREKKVAFERIETRDKIRFFNILSEMTWELRVACGNQ